MSEYSVGLLKRLAQAQRNARLIAANRPDDHASIARARAEVRRLQAAIERATGPGQG